MYAAQQHVPSSHIRHRPSLTRGAEAFGCAYHTSIHALGTNKHDNNTDAYTRSRCQDRADKQSGAPPPQPLLSLLHLWRHPCSMAQKDRSLAVTATSPGGHDPRNYVKCGACVSRQVNFSSRSHDAFCRVTLWKFVLTGVVSLYGRQRCEVQRKHFFLTQNQPWRELSHSRKCDSSATA